MFELSEKKQELLKTDGHILVLGGPGSGKTTIALLKAKRVIEEGVKNGQQVLFLSFARATVARLVQQTTMLGISMSIRQHLEINTYHGFTWNILKSHGYLINSNSPLRLLPPPEAAARLADIDGGAERETEKKRLFEEEGLLHFDLFANLSAELLSKSKSLAAILCDAYPVIILDEFQDTNADEWNLVRILGVRSRLIALADAEQRIFEFRGADPARIGEFILKFKPTPFDFGTENNRSCDTDIVQFGNDLLTGANIGKKYNDVKIIGYPPRKGAAIYLTLKCEVLKSCRRLKEAGQSNWSLAVLVPTNKLMFDVSDYLGTKHKFNGVILPEIYHEVAFDSAGPSLAANLIAGLLEGAVADDELLNRLIHDLCEYIRGRKGDNGPNKSELDLSAALKNYIDTKVIRGSKRRSIVNECNRLAMECKKINFTGNPADDWMIIRNILFRSEYEIIKQVAIDAKYLRLLHKGALFRSSLGKIWRDNQNYLGAADAVRNALLEEHFAASTKIWSGIHVMTIHKSKNKEFDEVIIYEGCHQGRIVRDNADRKEVDQSRLKLRVAVTRAIKRSTILSPRNDMCRFLR